MKLILYKYIPLYSLVCDLGYSPRVDHAPGYTTALPPPPPWDWQFISTGLLSPPRCAIHLGALRFLPYLDAHIDAEGGDGKVVDDHDVLKTEGFAVAHDARHDNDKRHVRRKYASNTTGIADQQPISSAGIYRVVGEKKSDSYIDVTYHQQKHRLGMRFFQEFTLPPLPPPPPPPN